MEATQENIDKVMSTLKAPYVSAFDLLGRNGPDSSILIDISLDQKETWICQNFYNSHYGRFSIENEKVTLVAKSYKVSKFRKCRYKTLEDALTKIQKWIDEQLANMPVA